VRSRRDFRVRLDNGFHLAATPVMVALAAVTMAASYVSKLPCSGPPYDEFGWSENMANGHRLLCLTDVQTLWLFRWIDVHRFPYLQGWLDLSDGPPGQLQDGAIEYPVLTGMFMWVAGLPSRNSWEFLTYTALMLLPLAVLVGWLLARLVGWRALVWAAAPAVVFYSVYNWDLLPVAWTLLAVFAWHRGRYAWAGACLGLGAASKIYPGFFLLPLVLERWVAGDRRGAVVVAGSGVGAWLAVNLPFVVANVEGWWATYAFQAGRSADLTTNSIYYWGFPEWSSDRVDRFSAGMILIGWVLAVMVGFLRWPVLGSYPWVQVSAAMLFVFLAFNKVYSPQYALWVLPFLALVALRWGWWVAFWCVDVTLFVGLLRWYATGDDLARQAASIGGWGKSVLLLLLSFAVLHSPLALRDPPAHGRRTAAAAPSPGRHSSARDRDNFREVVASGGP
jgi:uncharacterized membrane protein